MLHAAMVSLLALVGSLSLALPAHAAPAPIVFDFEDGLQGWELGGSAQRVQTQILGGEWAIFGDGSLDPCCIENDVDLGTSILIEMDLTGFMSITVEQFFVDGSEDALFLAAGDRVQGVIMGVLIPFVAIEAGNPSLRVADVSSLAGVPLVAILWHNQDPRGKTPSIAAFSDNITFHPVPEPTTLALLAGSLVALVIYRRRMM